MRAYIDGSSSGVYGYLITTPEQIQKVITDHPMTNNQAEWLALLSLLMDLEPNTKILIYSDSQIVVNQLTGLWETKNEMLRHLRAVCLLVIDVKKLDIGLHWIPRNENLFGKVLDKLLKNKRKKRKKFKERLEKGY